MTKKINGFRWILRPYANFYGVVSIALIFLVVSTLIFVSLLSYQYKKHYFDELKGVYPSFHSKLRFKNELETKLSHDNQGIILEKEYFQRSLELCLKTSETAAPQSVTTGVRTLSNASSALPNALLGKVEGKGVWMSLRLYESVFGHVPSKLSLPGNTLWLPVKGSVYDEQACKAREFIEYPVVKVFPLASSERWLVLRNDDIEKLHMVGDIVPIATILGNYDESKLESVAINDARLFHWFDMLSYKLKLRYRSLSAGFTVFLLFTVLLALSYFANLYKMTQKSILEGIFLLRFYGVSRLRLMSSMLIGLTCFWCLIIVFAFPASLALLSIVQASLFETFSAADFLLQLPVSSVIAMYVVTVWLPIAYVFRYFVGSFSLKWRSVYH
jgi:hypothetical protein